jgi:hypothetical protein
MKQPNSLVQISVNDVNLDSLSECAGQILAKEEAVLVIGGHLQHSSLLDKQKIYQAFEPRLLLLLEGEADLCVNLQDSHFEKGSIALVASDTIFEMKHISDDARVAVVIFRKDNEEIEDTFLSASPEEFERVVHLIMLLRDFMRVSPYRRRTVRSLLQTLVADVQEIRDGQAQDRTRGTPPRTFCGVQAIGAQTLRARAQHPLLCRATPRVAAPFVGRHQEDRREQRDVLGQPCHGASGEDSAQHEGNDELRGGRSAQLPGSGGLLPFFQARNRHDAQRLPGKSTKNCRIRKSAPNEKRAKSVNH